MHYYVVDSFATEVFKGNPAGVCVLDKPLPAEIMQAIAIENCLSETAFVVPRADDSYDLRWFAPTREIDLCGHATLATAFVISTIIDPTLDVMRFHTKSGLLTVTNNDGLLSMDFPARKPEKIELTDEIRTLVDVPVLEAYAARDLMLVLESEEAVASCVANIPAIAALDYLGVIITARGGSSTTDSKNEAALVDFVSRFFAPQAGVDEDPVTGSAHCTLIPFWGEILGKSKMTARQLSKRGGTLYCEDNGDRVVVAGHAVLYLQGEIKA